VRPPNVYESCIGMHSPGYQAVITYWFSATYNNSSYIMHTDLKINHLRTF